MFDRLDEKRRVMLIGNRDNTKMVNNMTLTLYRRHTKSCSQGMRQSLRVYKPLTKRQFTKDCSCPISAEGTLKIEGQIVNRSTKKNTWEEAEQVAQDWERWGQTTPIAETITNPTIEYAIQSFLSTKGPTGENVDEHTLYSFRILLEKRLLRFVRERGLKNIKQIENLDTVTKFTETWKNLHDESFGLADSTKKAELERLRAFYRYCHARKWIDENPASQIHFKFAVVEKFGMEPDEEIRLFKAIDEFSGNAKQLRVFCDVMRHSGLRIGDATTLHDLNLVRRVSGDGWALTVYQQKTNQWVYIPIPQFLADELHSLPKASPYSKYWFWTGIGKLDTATSNWYTKIQKVVDQVGSFRHPVTPHTFRHTFSITHLNNGVDLRIVSQWLGHKSVRTTEKHYAHAIIATKIASEMAAEKAMGTHRSLDRSNSI